MKAIVLLNDKDSIAEISNHISANRESKHMDDFINQVDNILGCLDANESVEMERHPGLSRTDYETSFQFAEFNFKSKDLLKTMDDEASDLKILDTSHSNNMSLMDCQVSMDMKDKMNSSLQEDMQFDTKDMSMAVDSTAAKEERLSKIFVSKDSNFDNISMND